jgi:hypothetical protein
MKHRVAALLAAASLTVAACSSSSSSTGVASGCYTASAGACMQYPLDLRDIAESCAAQGGVYQTGPSPCPTANVVGSCACPPDPVEGKQLSPIVFYAPKYTCERALALCARCSVDAAGNATAGTFTGACADAGIAPR